jgi:hypothetical protein
MDKFFTNLDKFALLGFCVGGSYLAVDRYVPALYTLGFPVLLCGALLTVLFAGAATMLMTSR